MSGETKRDACLLVLGSIVALAGFAGMGCGPKEGEEPIDIGTAGAGGQVEGTAGSPGTAGVPGTAGASGGPTGTAGATGPALGAFDLKLAPGTFWDYRWATGSSSYGQGSSSSGNSTFRVALGDARTIDGKTGYPVRVLGTAGSFGPRWKFLAFEDHVLLGSLDGARWSTVLDGKTGLVAGGGFFAALPGVFRARETSFSNAIVSGRGILVERSSSTTDTVCADGICVKGTAGDSNLTQQEFYLPTFGPAGYHFFFSTTTSSSQSSTREDVGLVATSLRGDKGLFVEELEPNDAPTSATQMQSTIVGTLGTSQPSFTVTQTYRNIAGNTVIGTATDTLQDCFLLNRAATSVGARIVWDPKSCGNCRMSIVMFDAAGKATTSDSAFKSVATDAVQAAGDVSHSDYYQSTTVCVGTTAPGPVSYVLY